MVPPSDPPDVEMFSFRGRRAPAEPHSLGAPRGFRRRWARSECEDRSELVAPRVRLSCRKASEGLPAALGSASVNVACFLNEGDPFVQSVGQRSRVEIRTGETVCTWTANISGHRSVGPIRKVQNPSGVATLRIGMEDPRKREARFEESAQAPNRPEALSNDAAAVAVKGCCCCPCRARASEQNGATVQGRDRRSYYARFGGGGGENFDCPIEVVKNVVELASE